MEDVLQCVKMVPNFGKEPENRVEGSRVFLPNCFKMRGKLLRGLPHESIDVPLRYIIST